MPTLVLLRARRDTAAATQRFPHRFESAASIHPYRRDAVDALATAAGRGARAVKWLPNSIGIDPAAPRCDAFYAALVRTARRCSPMPATRGGGCVGGGRTGQSAALRRALDQACV